MGPLHFETFVSLSCHNCPEVVQALNLLAAVNPAITHVMIDGARLTEEVERRGILAVPVVYLNGESSATVASRWRKSSPGWTPARQSARSSSWMPRNPSTCW
jgi:alkyl hydroperoxide reductase subunit AhpF